MFNILGKAKEAQAKMEETRERLKSVYVNGESAQGRVRVIAKASGELTELTIDDSLIAEGKEAIEEYVLMAVNKAVEAGNAVKEAEIKAAAKDVLPGIPGIDKLLG